MALAETGLTESAHLWLYSLLLFSSFYCSEIADCFELGLSFDVLASLVGLAITSRESDNVPTCGITFQQRSGRALDVPTASRYHGLAYFLDAEC